LTVPILGGISLLVFYLLAARLFRHPFAALAATATLAFAIPQVSFSRDSMPEIPTQILLFTALWLLCDQRILRNRGTGFCVGLLFGLLQAIHGDGLIFLVGLPVLFAVLWTRAKHADRVQLREGIIGFGIGAGTGLLLAALDFWLRNRSYLSTLQGNLTRVAVAATLVTLASIEAVRLPRHRPDLVDTLRSRRETAAKAGFALVVSFGFGAWIVRPLVQKTRGGANPIVGLVQRLDHTHVDPTRRYSELSLQWVSWYLGPVTLILAIIGAAALAYLFGRGSLRAPPATTALILAPPALLYIWRPSATPDQVWAARRFLPAVFPGLILAAFALLVAVARDRGRPGLGERRYAVVLFAVLAAAFPLYTIRDVSQMTEQRGLFPVITDTCRKIGPKGAVVMLPETQPRASIASVALPQTLRSFCDVPVMVARGTPRSAALRRLSTQWRARGRRLVLVSEYPESIQRVFPQASLQPSLVGEESHLLEATLTRRPSDYTTDKFHATAVRQLTIAAVPGTPRGRGPAG
jgi:hypothetical protein